MSLFELEEKYQDYLLNQYALKFYLDLKGENKVKTIMDNLNKMNSEDFTGIIIV